MDENVKKNYEYWCTSPIFDDATKAELKSLEGNEDEIFDRFYRELEFGTGGLRGVIGFGDDCCWIIILILLICCCCGGNRGGCC